MQTIRPHVIPSAASEASGVEGSPTRRKAGPAPRSRAPGHQSARRGGPGSTAGDSWQPGSTAGDNWKLDSTAGDRKTPFLAPSCRHASILPRMLSPGRQSVPPDERRALLDAHAGSGTASGRTFFSNARVYECGDSHVRRPSKYSFLHPTCNSSKTVRQGKGPSA